MPTTATRAHTLRRRQPRVAAIAPKPTNQDSTRVVLLSLLLALITLALYSPVRQHDFINYDDDIYVFKNLHVVAGLTWKTVEWALTTNEVANWHPVTWISHELDCQLFGLDAGFHHITSLLIHVLNVVLLFLVFCKITG